MRIEMNPAYESMRPAIESIPQRFEQEGEVVYKGRNLIKVMELEGRQVNVKRYHVPSLLNRVVYSFLRKPKGRRAFEYPQRLLQKGFETPEPIAYLEERRGGLIHYSYFVSVQSAYRRNFYEFAEATPEQYTEVAIAFARHTARLHEAGILHRDYSPGNILFDRIDGTYHFTLVDINRMKFGKIGLEEGCANFARLWGPIAFFELIAREYARGRQADEAYCTQQVLACRKKFWTRFAKRHYISFKLEL
ncbi:MAG: lipopolysaccharide kinase InaA family protein [Mediterranea sp.]|jgi:serine/threonine protein kinase|nr:lipopolysaccharide kinase InaA family protein [Mediterranea sp.]